MRTFCKFVNSGMGAHWLVGVLILSPPLRLSSWPASPCFIIRSLPLLVSVPSEDSGRPAARMLKRVVKLGEYDEERKSGERIKFVVQTAPLEMADEVVDHMTKFFLPREPMCSHRILGDPVSTKSLQDLWREAVQGGTTLVALQIIDGEPSKLIGANVTPISEKNPSEDKKFEGDNYNDVLEALIDVASRSNIFEKYGVDRYMTGYGLSVDAEYHGYKIGQRILECRRPLCKLLGVKATGTIFTASSSQHIAAQIGFETLLQYEYSTYTVNGKKPFGNLPGKMMMMGMKF